MRCFVALVLALALGATGCSESGAPSDLSPYASKDLWLCRPDIEADRCDTADLSMTEILPDGTMVELEELPSNPDAEVDCFYVYHTVDWREEAGNTEVLDPHPEDVIQALHRNGALYRGACRVFAPLYRQMTLGTYRQFLVGLEESEFFQMAYGDVREAFEYYMRRHNAGRGLVLVGHSQGSQMLTKLLQDEFDNDETLRAQLISALLIGGGVEVHEGDRVGGSFANIPLCTEDHETGCVIAFEANAAGEPPPPALILSPAQLACVNPATREGETGTLAALIYSRTYDHVIPFPDNVNTEWVRYPEIYESRCSGGEGFRNVLEVDCATGLTCDVPMTPQELQQSVAENWGLRGLHLVEYFIANTDLLRIIEQQIESRNN